MTRAWDKEQKKQKKILVGDFFFVPRSCQVDKFTFHISLILKVVYTDKTWFYNLPTFIYFYKLISIASLRDQEQDQKTHGYLFSDAFFFFNWMSEVRWSHQMCQKQRGRDLCFLSQINCQCSRYRLNLLVYHMGHLISWTPRNGSVKSTISHLF